MAGPIDAVRGDPQRVPTRHRAHRRGGARRAPAGSRASRATVERFRFFNEVLEWHAHGEELAIFPALEAVAPSVAEAYEKDHRALDAAFDALSNAVLGARRAGDGPGHQGVQVLPRRPPRQGGRAPVPPHRRARLGARPGPGRRCHGQHRSRRTGSRSWWRGCSRCMGHDDRENMTRIWQHVMPPEAFAGATQLVDHGDR